MREIFRNLWKLVLHMGYKFIPRKTISVLDRDWDWLVVLDACRFDDFVCVNFLPGKLERYYSCGSSTLEWLQKNFDRDCDDVVYFSANPKVSETVLRKHLGFNPFYRVVPVWKYCWDKQFQTVLPRSVNMIVVENLGNFQGKRKIVHYLQPHYPFLSLIPWLRTSDVSHLFDDDSGGSGFIQKIKKEVFIGDVGIVWKMLRRKKIDVDAVRDAYRENIRIVLNAVRQLLPYLDGKVVVTSDHGNLFGEYFLFAHPYGVYVKPLIEVPWLEVDMNGYK